MKSQPRINTDEYGFSCKGNSHLSVCIRVHPWFEVNCRGFVEGSAKSSHPWKDRADKTKKLTANLSIAHAIAGEWGQRDPKRFNLPRSTTASRESAIGLPHFKTLARIPTANSFRKVVECGSPMPHSRAVSDRLRPDSHIIAWAEFSASETLRSTLAKNSDINAFRYLSFGTRRRYKWCRDQAAGGPKQPAGKNRMRAHLKAYPAAGMPQKHKAPQGVTHGRSQYGHQH
jgi:hypothetical protein